MPLLPNTPWTDIDSVRVAVDAPVSTDLMTDIVINLNYLRANQSAKRMSAFYVSGSFTVPLDTNNIIAEGQAAGGGGGGDAGGGGAGAYAKVSLAVTPGEVITYVIGAHGNGGVANGDGTSAANLTITGSFGTVTIGGGKFGHGSFSGGAGGAATPITNSATLFGYNGSAGVSGTNGDGGVAAFGLEYGSGGSGNGNPGLAGYLLFFY